MRDTFSLLVVGLSLLAAVSAHAGPAPADPTRPAGFTRTVPTPAVRGVGAVDAATAPAPVRPMLQSLQVPVRGESSALVDGRVVRVGDRLGETVVVTIDTQGILLRGPRYEQRIALVPGGGKTPSTSADTAVASTAESTAGPTANTTANTTASKTVNKNASRTVGTAAKAGSAAILTAPLVTRPAPAVVVVPKEPR